jgi:hypothetical protein
MPGISHRSIIPSRTGVCKLFLSVWLFLGLCAAILGSSPRIILEVINSHFTVGRRIPSVYLRVFFDGTVECHTIKYVGDEKEIVKKGKLTPEEFGRLESLLNAPEMLNVRKRYELMYRVIDSWMEWDIKVPHSGKAQEIQVLNFSPGAARDMQQPYPDALVKLGCSILKMRNEVYRDEPNFLDDDCKNALEAH